MSDLEAIKRRLAEIRAELHALRDADLVATDRVEMLNRLIQEMVDLHEQWTEALHDGP